MNPSDVVDVVFCDNSLNRIELEQMARHYPSWGTRIDPTDIAPLAQAMGCDGINVDSVRGLEAALAGPRSSERPLVIGANRPEPVRGPVPGAPRTRLRPTGLLGGSSKW
jgi:thiamine pyrophosphate-dependent acetolactate synthase large subunit-like protein